RSGAPGRRYWRQVDRRGRRRIFHVLRALGRATSRRGSARRARSAPVALPLRPRRRAHLAQFAPGWLKKGHAARLTLARARAALGTRRACAASILRRARAPVSGLRRARAGAARAEARRYAGGGRA